MNLRCIDFHAHIYPAAIAQRATEAIGKFYEIPMVGGQGDLQGLLASGREWPGDITYVLHSAATTPRQVRSINEFIAQSATQTPNAIGFGTLHPDMENMAAEIAHMEALGLRGVKLHPDFQRFAIDSPQSIRMLQQLEQRLPVIVHAGDTRFAYDTPAQIANVLRQCPKLTLIAAHLGGYSQWQQAYEQLSDTAVYYDTSSALFALTPEEACRIIRAHGVDRVLFGSDYPMWNHRGEFQRFMALPLQDAEREKILYQNGAALLGLTAE